MNSSRSTSKLIRSVKYLRYLESMKQQVSARLLQSELNLKTTKSTCLNTHNALVEVVERLRNESFESINVNCYLANMSFMEKKSLELEKLQEESLAAKEEVRKFKNELLVIIRKISATKTQISNIERATKKSINKRDDDFLNENYLRKISCKELIIE